LPGKKENPGPHLIINRHGLYFKTEKIPGTLTLTMLPGAIRVYLLKVYATVYLHDACGRYFISLNYYF